MVSFNFIRNIYKFFKETASKKLRPAENAIITVRRLYEQSNREKGTFFDTHAGLSKFIFVENVAELWKEQDFLNLL